VGHLLDTARTSFAVANDAEITMEANPGTVTADWLAAVRALSVNRLSFGVQSALPGELALLGRAHDFAAAVEAVEMATAAGFDNLNLDLIYGLPGQSAADWAQTLTAVLALAETAPAVTHISLYCLTIEPGTPMQRWLHGGAINAPDPDTAADQYELAGRELAAAGFGHYEISNWARPGRECRHNVVYWRNEPYLGLGAGAHGLAGGYRYQVVRQPRAYVRRMAEATTIIGGVSLASDSVLPFPLSSAVAAYHRVDAAEAMSDTAITQLRLLDEGLDMAGFATRFGQAFDDVYANEVQQLEAWQLLHRHDGRLLLTERGRFLSNRVFVEFV
jgi:oxygen-independent coproporphyrinogen-3 oxidase